MISHDEFVEAAKCNAELSESECSLMLQIETYNDVELLKWVRRQLEQVQRQMNKNIDLISNYVQQNK